jgi:cytochrome c2
MNRVNVVRGLVAGMAIGLATPSAARAAGQGTAPGDAAKGEKVYAAQKCHLCHKIGAVGGKMGPDLSAVGAKRDAAWMEKYLLNPKMVDPKNKMPAVKVKPQDLADLIAYLGTLGKKK